MSSPAITMREDTPIEAAAALLAAHGFTAVPVVDGDGRLVGLATEGDLVRGQIAAEDSPRPPPDVAPQTVGQAMTRSPATLSPDTDLADVVALMLEADVRSVPLVENGELVGVVTPRNVLRVIAHGHRPPPMSHNSNGQE